MNVRLQPHLVEMVEVCREGCAETREHIELDVVLAAHLHNNGCNGRVMILSNREKVRVL